MATYNRVKYVKSLHGLVLCIPEAMYNYLVSDKVIDAAINHDCRIINSPEFKRHCERFGRLLAMVNTGFGDMKKSINYLRGVYENVDKDSLQ